MKEEALKIVARMIDSYSGLKGEEVVTLVRAIVEPTKCEVMDCTPVQVNKDKLVTAVTSKIAKNETEAIVKYPNINATSTKTDTEIIYG